MKQVFPPGRKTCSLSHNRCVLEPFSHNGQLREHRLGDRHREIGVHFTPTDLTAAQLNEALGRCQTLWREKILARWAVPDMFECVDLLPSSGSDKMLIIKDLCRVDLLPGLANPLQGYKDVENVVNNRWPSREAMIKAEGADPSRFKRCLCLIVSLVLYKIQIGGLRENSGLTRSQENQSRLLTWRKSMPSRTKTRPDLALSCPMCPVVSRQLSTLRFDC